MPIRFKTQLPASVDIPPSGYATMFVDTDGHLKVKDTTGFVAVVGSSGSSDPYTAAPTAPDSWDLDATLMTDPDLGNNGWTVRGWTSPWSTLTRAGDITRGPTPPSLGTYQSTLINGVLIVKFPAGDYTITKPSTGSYLYKVHMWPGDYTTQTEYHLIFGNTYNFGQSGNVVYYVGRTDGSLQYFVWTGPSSFVGTTTADTKTEATMNRVHYALDTGSGTRTIQPYVMRPDGTRAFDTLNASASVSFTTGVAGVHANVARASGENWFHITQIRRLPTTSLM